MPDIANLLGNVLYGKRSGIRTPGATTPGFNGKPVKLYQGPPDPGNPIDIGADGGYTPDEARLRTLIANPPQEGVKPDGTKIGGVRRVLGEIASTVGPMIGGPAVAGLGQKLLHPGLEKYGSDVARAQALAQLSGSAEDRKDREFNRKAVRDATQERIDARKREDAQAQINNITGPGKGWEIPEAPTAPETRQVLKPQMPTAVNQPAPPPEIATQNIQGPSPVEQVDDVTGKPLSQVGTVNEVQMPGGAKTRYVRPSRNTLADLDASAAKKKKEAEQDLWEPLPTEIATALKLPPDTRVPNLAPYATMYEAHLKDNSLHFDRSVDENTGDVTLTLLDPKTGAIKKTQVIKGVDKKRPQVTNINAANARGDKSYQFNIGELNTARKPVDDAVSRLGRLQDTIAQGNMQADALVAPELLTVMAGGAGSGLRMNEAEIARIIGGRTQYENLKAFLQKWNTDPNAARSITPDQEKQIKKLVSTVHSKLLAKQGVLTEARKALIDSEDPNDHRKAVATALEKLAAIDGSSDGAGIGQTPSGLPQVGGTFNGGKVLKVTPIK